jgi:hypothetical protein
LKAPAYGGLVGPASDAVKLAAAHLPGHSASTGSLAGLGHMREIQYRGRTFDHGIGWFRKPGDANRSPRVR